MFGTADEVAIALKDLTARTGADEILVTTTAFDAEDRLDSYRQIGRHV